MRITLTICNVNGHGNGNENGKKMQPHEAFRYRVRIQTPSNSLQRPPRALPDLAKPRRGLGNIGRYLSSHPNGGQRGKGFGMATNDLVRCTIDLIVHTMVSFESLWILSACHSSSVPLRPKVRAFHLCISSRQSSPAVCPL